MIYIYIYIYIYIVKNEKLWFSSILWLTWTKLHIDNFSKRWIKAAIKKAINWLMSLSRFLNYSLMKAKQQQQHQNNKKFTDTYWFFDGHKAMTDPSSCRAISANVCKSFVIITIRGTKRNFFYCLVNYHTL